MDIMMQKQGSVKESVQKFYDRQWHASDEELFAHAFEEAIAYSYSLLGELKGKKLLELGCGSGKQAFYFAEKGAEVTVIDISPESIQAVEKLAAKQASRKQEGDLQKQKQLSQKPVLRAMLMNAESLDFPPETFDAIYINSVMMHVHHQAVLQECARVLKRGGRLVIIEPLKYAPFVQLYRLLGSYRKMKPRYATLSMFRRGKEHFSDGSCKEFYLFSSALLPLLYFRKKALSALYRVAARLDDALLRGFPPLRRLCWVTVACYEKGEE